MHTSELNYVFIDNTFGAKAADLYRRRRQQVIQSSPHPIIMTGIHSETHPDHSFSHFRPFIVQDPAMLYLTGINQANALLVITTEKQLIFLPKKNKKTEFWDGKKLAYSDDVDNAALSQLLGCDSILPISSFKTVIKELFSDKKEISSYWHEPKEKNQKRLNDHHARFAKELNRTLPHCTVHNAHDLITEIRLRLDEADLQALKTAIQKTATAFTDTLRQLPSADTESDVAATLDGAIAKQSYFRNSFSSIVANGKNAGILHYVKNNDPLNKSHLLLLDFGLRWQAMCSDISRTIPLSGKFNPLQALLYNCVLTAQKAVESAAKAGCTIQDLNDLCWKTLNNELTKKVIQKGGKITKAYDINPHNVGHLIAHQVHDGDVYRNYKSIPLKAGNIITNEPGFYGHVQMKINGHLYSDDIGIRIEDDLLITEEGCENLSKAIPKSIAQIEKLLQSSVKS